MKKKNSDKKYKELERQEALSKEKNPEDSEMKNIKVSMAVKKYLDSQGRKGETYDSLLQRLLKISPNGRYGDIEEKITKCAEDIVKWKQSNLPNDYHNIARYIYNIGYENDDIGVTIRKDIMGNNWLCYTVNGLTFAKVRPEYDRVFVGWLAEIEDKLVWQGPFHLIKSDDFNIHFYNNFLKNIKEAYHLARRMVSEMGDRYIGLANRIATIEESIRKIQDELKLIKKKEGS